MSRNISFFGIVPSFEPVDEYSIDSNMSWESRLNLSTVSGLPSFPFSSASVGFSLFSSFIIALTVSCSISL